MARKEIDCLARRSLLNSNNETPESLTAIGLDYLEAGFLSDAIDFLAKAGNMEALKEIMPQAIEQGDYFILNRIKKLLNQDPSASELKTLAANAEKLGKTRFAAQASDRLKESGPPAGEE